MLESLKYITPELILIITAFAVTLIGAFSEKLGKHAPKIGLIALAAALDACYLLYTAEPQVLFNGFFVIDSFAFYAKMLILVATFFVLLLSLSYRSPDVRFEATIIILLAAVGMCSLVSANDLISMYMSIELTSLSLYIMAAFIRTELRSSEAGLKYFMLGALASGILLFGCSFIYGFGGSTDFAELGTKYTSIKSLPIEVLVGLILVMIGLFFKISAVPFHMWTPDVYEGSHRLSGAYFATAPKIAVFALLIRLLLSPFSDLSGDWGQIINFVAVASMAVGAFGALVQTNIKRLLAYSSIGHVGFALLALTLPNGEQIPAIMIYLTIYLVMSIGAWALVISMRNKDDKHLHNISDLAGLAKYNPVRGFCFAVIMFSMAGIPPLAGFFAKFAVLKGLIVNDMIIQASIAVLLTVVSAYYYLRIIKICYFDEEPNDNEKIADLESVSVRITIFWTVVANLLFIIWPSIITTITSALVIF